MSLSVPKSKWIRSHSWKCISEQKPSQEVKGTACRAQRQDCVEAQIRVSDYNALKVPRSTVAFLQIRSLEQPGLLTRAGSPAKLSNWGRRALVSEVTENPTVTLAELQRSYVEMGETSRNHCNTLGFMAGRNPLLSERHMKACLEFAKKPLKHSVFFSSRDWGTGQGWGKAEQWKIHVLNENLVQSAQDLRLGRRFTFQDNDHKHTAETAQEGLRDNSRCGKLVASYPRRL